MTIPPGDKTKRRGRLATVAQILTLLFPFKGREEEGQNWKREGKKKFATVHNKFYLRTLVFKTNLRLTTITNY